MRPTNSKHTTQLSQPYHVLAGSGNNIINHTFDKYNEALNDATEIVGNGSVETALVVNTVTQEVTYVTPVQA